MERDFKLLEIGDLHPFARGGTGECYRLDEDTILKLYFEGFPIETIRREKDGARAALVAGVPTAISFDQVRVGNRYGVVYELVQGKTLSELAAQTPSRARELGGTLAEIARTLHGTRIRCGDLPRATDHIRVALPEVDYAPEGTVRRIEAFMDRLDESRRYVHGDFNSNNVIVTADGPLLVDMGDFSLGSPMFDLATLRFSLFESPEALAGGRSAFTGMTPDEAQAFWQGFERAYFGGEMDSETEALLSRVTLLKKLRFERLFGARCPEAYREAVRKEVCETFGD